MPKEESLVKYWFKLIMHPEANDDDKTRDGVHGLDTQTSTPETPTPLGEDE